MRPPVDLGDARVPALFDGALSLALATGTPLRLHGPLSPVDASVALAAVRVSELSQGAVEGARSAFAQPGPVELLLPHARAASHTLDLREPGAVARAFWTLIWPLAILGKPSELRLMGPNHSDGCATFHDLRLVWVPLAARFGVKLSLELPLAGFGADEGELLVGIDPGPALQPLHLVHRGILRSVSVLAAVGGGRDEEPIRAMEQAARRLRASGVIAEAERVPVPLHNGAPSRGRWALTALAEFEHSVVSASALGAAQAGPALVRQAPAPVAAAKDSPGDRVAAQLSRFFSCRGAVDGPTAERLLVPAILCAAGLGARAGTPPTCHFTTSEVTEGLVALATLARRMLPVRAVVDGAVGDEGVVVVAPST